MVGWSIRSIFYFITDRSKVVTLLAQQGPFLVTTLCNPAQSTLPNPAQFSIFFPAPCLKLLFSAFMSLIRWSCSFRFSEMEWSTERSIARQTWVLYPCLLPLQNVLLYSPSARVAKSMFSYINPVKLILDPPPLFSRQNKKHMVLKCACDPMFLEEAAEAIWRLVNVYMHWLPIEVHQFFVLLKQCGTTFLIVLRHYFSGDGKVSRLRSASFQMNFLSLLLFTLGYRTKRESPGLNFWSQWVAISSPEIAWWISLEEVENIKNKVLVIFFALYFTERLGWPRCR